MTVLLPLSFALLLNACATTETVKVNQTVITSTPQVSVRVVNCKSAPKPPSGTEYTQKDVAVYIAKLESAHRDCKGNLRALNQIVDQTR